MRWPARRREGPGRVFRTSVPTQTRAGKGLAPFGKSGKGSGNAQCVRVQARENECAAISRGAVLAYGGLKNYSHSSQRAESIAGSGLQREGSLRFQIPLFPIGEAR